MFKFEKYPEIKKVHQVYNKLSNATYKAEFRYEKSGNQKDNEAWGKSIESARPNYEVYSQTVFDAFSGVKPKLFNIRTEKYEKWDEVITSSDFSKLSENEKKTLFGIVERQFLYRLPPEYYDK